MVTGSQHSDISFWEDRQLDNSLASARPLWLGACDLTPPKPPHPSQRLTSGVTSLLTPRAVSGAIHALFWMKGPQSGSGGQSGAPGTRSPRPATKTPAGLAGAQRPHATPARRRAQTPGTRPCTPQAPGEPGPRALQAPGPAHLQPPGSPVPEPRRPHGPARPRKTPMPGHPAS